MKKIVNREGHAMCLYEAIDEVAMDACCLLNDPNNVLFDRGYYLCNFSFERASSGRSQSRCQDMKNTWPSADMCDWKQIQVNVPDSVHGNRMQNQPLSGHRKLALDESELQCYYER